MWQICHRGVSEGDLFTNHAPRSRPNRPAWLSRLLAVERQQEATVSEPRYLDLTNCAELLEVPKRAMSKSSRL